MGSDRRSPKEIEVDKKIEDLGNKVEAITRTLTNIEGFFKTMQSFIKSIEKTKVG